MNALACAPDNVNSRASQFNFNWKKHEVNVKKLQMRIVKAQQERRYNKVKAIQWLLVHSFSAKILAIKRVTENKGKKTPGIDQVTWTTQKQKYEAINELRRVGYTAEPLRRVFIPKKNGKKRPLGIPTMKDRAVQALYLQALDPVAETILDNDTYGFRLKRSTADAIEAIFKAVFANKDCSEWVIEGDIKGCFDNISHKWLIENIPLDKRILTQWLKAGIVFQGEYSDTFAGTPQGGIISPCLANLALNGLGSMLKKKFMTRKVVKGKEINNKVHTIVYADDFIITGKSRELLEAEVLPEVNKFMAERGLKLSEEKTVITHISDGFDFLGQNIRKYKGKVLVKPSKDNIKRFLENIRKIIEDNPMIKQEDLIRRLNPKIRGWANYHRHIAAKETFSYVDYHIYNALQSWCQRRHPKKGKWWINKKYFHHVGNRHWVFAAETENGKLLELLRADATKIIRHTKIRKKANPYDPEWNLYFEEREGDRMFESMNGRKRLKAMWKKQRGKCLICRNEINKESGWKIHTSQSGKKELTHPDCYKNTHSESQNVEPVEVQ
jgi:RNA-directed DNA polymerase